MEAWLHDRAHDEGRRPRTGCSRARGRPSAQRGRCPSGARCRRRSGLRTGRLLVAGQDHPSARWRVGGTMLCAFSITPLGVGESVGREVADVVRIVRESGLSNETNAMFTNVEGTWDDVMGLLKR